MKKGLMVLFMVVIFVGPIQAQNAKVVIVNMAPKPDLSVFYPECPVQPDINKTEEYSLPAFSRPCYWVRYWNANGHVVETDEWDGIAWDGNFIYNSKVSAGKVYFKGPREECYFFIHQVVDDPRLTNWWWGFIGDKHKTLWEAIELAALTEEHPDVTRAIINHMVQSGFVSQDEIDSRKMTSEQITKVLCDYTRPAVTHVYHATLAATEGGLTEEKFKDLQAGDRIQEFYWYRYGPYPTPTNRIYTVLRKEGETVVVKDNRGDETKLPLPKGEMWKFIKVVPH